MKKDDMIIFVTKAIGETKTLNERANDYRSSTIYGKRANYYIRKENNSYELMACCKDYGEEFEAAMFCGGLLSDNTVIREMVACIGIIEEDYIWND